MKKFLILTLALFILTACGKPPPEKTEAPSRAPFQTSSLVQSKQQSELLAEGIQNLKNSDFNGAIKNFDEAIKRDPLNPRGYIVLGQVYLNMRNYDRAIDTFTAATRVAPDDGEIYYLLSTSLGLAGRREEAIETAEQSVEMFRQAKDQENFVKAIALLQGLSAAQKQAVATE